MNADPTHIAYTSLVERTDKDFEEKRLRHADQIKCRRGCHQCCEPNLTIGVTEREYLQKYLKTHPEMIQTLRTLQTENPHHGKRCHFLTKEGACGIYEVRPLMCRTFGVPWKHSLDDGVEHRGVCELNFNETPLESLSSEDLIDLNPLTHSLAILNLNEWNHQIGIRFSLSLESILESHPDKC